MIYTDEENKRWWTNLTKMRQAEIVGTMLEKATYPPMVSLANNLASILQNGGEFSPKQLAAMRKWDNE